MNIVDDVGMNYFLDRFNGCIFLGENGNPHILEHIRGQRIAQDANIRCLEVIGEGFKASVQRTEVSREFFSSLSFLKLPPIGYRMSEDGRYLCYFQRKNTSYTRGITTGNCVRSYADHTKYMFDMGKLNRIKAEEKQVLASILAKPRFHTLTEGVEHLNNGDLLCFVNSPDIAVVPENEELYNVMFKQVHVGNINPDGELSMLPSFSDVELEFVV